MLFDPQPDNIQPADKYLCRFSDVANTPQAITILVLLLLSFLIFAVILYYTFLMKKLRAPKSVLVFVYGTMILWATVFAAQYIISLIAYKLNAEVSLYENYSHNFLTIIPKFILALDLTAAILIQTLLLIVPYFWIRNIVYFLEHSDEIESKGTKLFNKSTKYYIIISRSIVSALILSLFFIPGTLVHNFNDGLRIFIVAEAAITVCYLFFAFWLLRKKLKKIAQVESFKTILCQGIFIIAICIVRCLQNLVVNLLAGKMNIRVWELQLCVQQSDRKQYMLVLLFGIIFMHFTPIIIIMFIYKPTIPEEQESDNYDRNNQSLISTN